MRSRLGIITDEITQDFSQALDFISSYKLNYCELREFWYHNVMDSLKAELDRAKEFLNQHRLRVSDIASPTLKWNLPQMPAVRGDFTVPPPPDALPGDLRRSKFSNSLSNENVDTLLLRSFELARFFGTDKVRVFSFWRVENPEKAYPYVRDRLAKAADIARQHGIVLVLENEHECNVGTGKELGRILRDINSPNLRGNWDPGNAAMLGEVPYPDGYNAVKGLFTHMHVKDVKKAGNKLAWAPVGGGFIDWKGQLKAVKADGYDGTLSLETHYRRADHNAEESTRESLQGLIRILEEV